MDTFEKQRKIFTIVAILVLLSVLSLIAVIPGILLDTSPGSLPWSGAIGTLVVMGLHLLLAYWYGIRLRRRRGKINKGLLIASAIGLVVLGFLVMDGAFAFLDVVPFVSIGMLLCVFCDFAAALVSIAALFLLKQKKKKQPG